MIQDELVRKIDIQLQFRSKVPLTDQVRKAIFDLIQRGELPVDSLLPTVRELAAQLGVNFNTIARAYRALDKEGWLITRQGRGTIVTRPATAPKEDSYEGKIRQLASEIQRAAEQYGVDHQEILQKIAQRIQAKHTADQPPRRKRKRSSAARFRPFQASFPRSKKTRRETMDWWLKKPKQ